MNELNLKVSPEGDGFVYSGTISELRKLVIRAYEFGTLTEDKLKEYLNQLDKQYKSDY